ncbi:MAG: MerR family transcriptional regulator [Eubacteriales bacterium]
MMEFTINKLSKMAGVSTRTLRYYDEIGLLKPKRLSPSGYRIYGQEEVDILQQILFYRELGFRLDKIKKVIISSSFDKQEALSEHLSALVTKRNQLNALIANVEKTISASKGETTISDNEKFDGFKQRVVDSNEKKYGAEVRAKYGNDVVDKSNAKIKGMSQEHYKDMEKLSQEINKTLKLAFKSGDPAGELAIKACEMHKTWLIYFWGGYSKKAHKSLAQTYVDDPRFTEYYDKIAPGCAKFFRDAIINYCK